MAAGVAARLFHFDHPIDDGHQWRQAQTLIQAASYGHGAGWLTPAGNWYGATWVPTQLEFPIYQVLAFLLGKLVGLAPAGRIVSFAASAAGILVFDRILHLAGHPRRRAATVLFGLAPLGIFLGHSTQPDSLMLFLSLVAFYAALRSRDGGWTWPAVAAVGIAGAGVIKPTALVMLAFPFAYMAWRDRRLSLVAVLAAGMVAVAAWGLYDRAVLLVVNPGWYATNTRSVWVFGTLDQRLDINNYITLLQRVALIVLSPLVAGLALRFWAIRGGDPGLWLAWGVGALASVLVFANLNIVHYYYQLPLVAPLAAIAAYSVPSLPRPKVHAALVSMAFLLVTAVGCQDMFKEDPTLYRAGTALAALRGRSGPVIAMSWEGSAPWFPSLMYYTGREGWVLPLDATAETIDSLPGPPPCDLVEAFDGPARRALPRGWREVERTDAYVIGRRIGVGCPSA